MSRKNIEDFCQTKMKQETALISVTDFGYSFANLKHRPQYLLQLSFDDVPVGDGFFEEAGRKLSEAEVAELEKRYHSITDDQIKQVVDFYNFVKNSTELLICQCEHGQSRSAALAAAFSEHSYGKGIEVFSDDRYWPNKSIYRTVLRKLKT